MTEARGEIRGSDEQTIDARRRGYLFDFVEGARRFDLHDGRDLRVGRLHVVASHAVGRGPHDASDAAQTIERLGARILREAHRVGSFFGGLDIGEHQRACASVHHALDEPALARRYAHHRFARQMRGGNRTQLRGHVATVVGRVLHVDQQPVEAGVSERLSGGIAAERQP